MDNNENIGLYLLKKGQKGMVSAVFSRLGIFIILIVLQILCMFSIFKWFGDFLPHIYGITITFTIFIALYLLDTDIDPTAKITWLIAIMGLPVFGRSKIPLYR